MEGDESFVDAPPAPVIRPTQPVASMTPRVQERVAPMVAAVTPPPPAVKEEPAKEEPAALSEPVETDRLWPELLGQVRSKRPLISQYLETGALLKVENGFCLVGYPKDQTMAMESIQRPNNRKFVEELISTMVGKPTSLKCEVREGLVVTPPVLPEIKPEVPVDPKAKADEEFKNDPKIKKAMEIFEAEILSSK